MALYHYRCSNCETVFRCYKMPKGRWYRCLDCGHVGQTPGKMGWFERAAEFMESMTNAGAPGHCAWCHGLMHHSLAPVCSHCGRDQPSWNEVSDQQPG